MYFIGIDDTDNLESRGTGHLARSIAAELARDYPVLGVTRHQLLDDPRVPRTKKNSCAAIALNVNGQTSPNTLLANALLERVRALMLDDFQPGSDPGLCVCGDVHQAITAFGRRAQQELLDQGQARAVAQAHAILLQGLGGTEDGVIGALAAVGLAASGSDGRYVMVGRSRQLSGLQPIDAVLAAGISAVQTLDGQPVRQGLVQTDKLRPARRSGQPIAVVQWNDDHWQPLKLD